MNGKHNERRGCESRYDMRRDAQAPGSSTKGLPKVSIFQASKTLVSSRKLAYFGPLGENSS